MKRFIIKSTHNSNKARARMSAVVVLVLLIFFEGTSGTIFCSQPDRGLSISIDRGQETKKIEGTGSAIFYYVPETMEEGKSSDQAMVTVIVKDEAGQETTETYTFNILAKEEEPLKPVTEDTSQPQPEKKGMSRNTKIALGAGAAAALVGGIAIAAGGDDGGSKEKTFSGTFKREWSIELLLNKKSLYI